jgi:hypothetical protein
MCLVGAVTVLVGEEAQRGHKELRLLEGLNLQEVEVVPRTTESPRRRVVFVRRQFRRVIHAEGEAAATSAKLDVERAVGARSDAAEAGRAAVAWRHPDVEEKRRAENKNSAWRVEKKK